MSQTVEQACHCTWRLSIVNNRLATTDGNSWECIWGYIFRSIEQPSAVQWSIMSNLKIHSAAAVAHKVMCSYNLVEPDSSEIVSYWHTAETQASEITWKAWGDFSSRTWWCVMQHSPLAIVLMFLQRSYRDAQNRSLWITNTVFTINTQIKGKKTEETNF